MEKVLPLIHPDLIQVINRFPAYSGDICNLFKKNCSFQEICLDYKKCCKIVRHWQQQHTTEAAERTVEYAEIISALEQEIILYLNENNLQLPGVKTK